jgi:dihydrofolate reductase
MMLSIIVAAATNGIIGHAGTMPWHLPADLRYFKQVTMGCPVIMGRKTYDSIGKPLPGRRNIVITRNAQWEAHGVEAATSLTAALSLVADAPQVFLIGGGQLYAQALAEDSVQRIYLTRVHAQPQGDTRFPIEVLDAGGYQLVERTHHPADERNAYALDFELWERL